MNLLNNTIQKQDNNKIIKKYIIILFFLGFFLHLFLASSYWVGGDQINLLKVGNQFAGSGHLTGFGKWTGGSGSNIGSFLEIAVGLPLMIFPHFRSPMIVIIIFNLIAYILLANEFKKLFQLEGVLIFTIIYWLSPIRIYNSGFLWEPAYLFLFAALHFISAIRLKDDKNITYTVLHLLSIIIAFQIHNSALILLLSTSFLVLFKKIKLHPLGKFIALILGLISLIPTINTIMANSFPEGKGPAGYFGRGFVEVIPFLKGVFYWLKMSGYDVVRELKETNYLDYPQLLVYLLQLLSILTVVISIAANWFYFRGRFLKKYQTEYTALSPDNKWIMDLSLSYAVGLILSAGLSPIYLQGWMVVITLPVSMFPLFFLILNNIQRFTKYKIIYASVLFVSIQVILILFICFGQQKFNRYAKLPEGINQQQNKEIIHLFK